MSDYNHKEEGLSRQQAAERLIDLAYALTTAGELEMRIAGRRIAVPVAKELCLERELRTSDDQVELELGLKWSTE